mmetsp:Transcript_12052/g.28300  ORF Transcript_12052/g.28300 Transcript_12052/m.28300 type:complete len:176 (-) Transcript_12052:97-624(-)
MAQRIVEFGSSGKLASPRSPRPASGARPGKGGSDLGLFTDAHDFIKNVGGEVEELKRDILAVDEARRAELQELRSDLEQERLARRNSLNELRYEFEEFVHKKIDKVIDEVEDMKRTERSNDTAQEMQLAKLIEDVDRLKESLYGVQSAWSKLVSDVLVPPPDNEIRPITGQGSRV